ncbi:CD1107 family mobile element protein [Helcococcus ovis]|uniref:CD1107 family mobile element protein n=1 Tax=Helcococcus ovis TaxID=72026 RepID=UPI00106FFB18|nr:DUF4366 domain-containing protein [Helcococcus ovis]TFF65014.1 DUF4366 domain-containing protein [Helcococcus ovis]
MKFKKKTLVILTSLVLLMAFLLTTMLKVNTIFANNVEKKETEKTFEIKYKKLIDKGLGKEELNFSLDNKTKEYKETLKKGQKLLVEPIDVVGLTFEVSGRIGNEEVNNSNYKKKALSTEDDFITFNYIPQSIVWGGSLEEAEEYLKTHSYLTIPPFSHTFSLNLINEEKTKKTDSSTQTDSKNLKDAVVQTDNKILKKKEAQTDTKSLSNIYTQTDNKSLKDSVVQTDSRIFKNAKTQTDTENKKEISTQTDDKNKNDTVTQTETQAIKNLTDKAIQTDEITKLDKSTQTDKKETLDKEKELNELKEKIEKLNKDLKDKDKENLDNKKVKTLEDELLNLKRKIRKNKKKSNNTKLDNLLKELEQKIISIEEKVNKLNSSKNDDVVKSIVSKNEIAKSLPNTSLYKENKGSNNSFNTRESDENKYLKSQIDKNVSGKEIRYPNKLTPKAPSNNNQNSNVNNTNKNLNTNKGIASKPSKARASVVENKDNANNDYPVYRGEENVNGYSNYLADARQFVTFKTKNGKTFHLIINHDEKSENVMLLTEVSEDDLLNMVEKDKKPKEEVKKIEEPKKEEVKPVKKEEKSNLGTYILLALVLAATLGAGYYFKVIKKKENEDIESFEDDEDDDFFANDSQDEKNEENVEDEE